MKKHFFFSIAALLSAGCLSASTLADRPITVEQLPETARKFVRTHFASSELLYAQVDDELFGNDYKVVFADGASIEFAANGEWKDVEAKRGGEVPAAIVPQAIREQVVERFPGVRIVGIDRDRKGFDVGLSNGFELEFDRHLRLVDIDD